MIFVISVTVFLWLTGEMPSYVVYLPIMITTIIMLTVWLSFNHLINSLLSKICYFFVTIGVLHATQTLALGLWLMYASGELQGYKSVFLFLGPFQQTMLTLAAAIAGLAYAMKKTHSPIKKLKLLVAELCVLSILIIASKNEQYLPIYLLVELGTCTFLINVLKQHSSSSQKDTTAAVFVTGGLLCLIIALLYCSGNAYWQTSMGAYLAPTQQQSDFGALKLSIYHLLKQIMLPLLVFILVITVLLIAMSKQPVTLVTETTVKKTKHKLLKNAHTANQQNDTAVKNGSTTTNKFNK